MPTSHGFHLIETRSKAKRWWDKAGSESIGTVCLAEDHQWRYWVSGDDDDHCCQDLQAIAFVFLKSDPKFNANSNPAHFTYSISLHANSESRETSQLDIFSNCFSCCITHSEEKLSDLFHFSPGLASVAVIDRGERVYHSSYTERWPVLLSCTPGHERLRHRQDFFLAISRL